MEKPERLWGVSPRRFVLPQNTIRLEQVTQNYRPAQEQYGGTGTVPSLLLSAFLTSLPEERNSADPKSQQLLSGNGNTKREKSVVSIICIWQEETASRSRVSAGSDCVSGDCCALGKDRTPFFGKTPFYFLVNLNYLL